MMKEAVDTVLILTGKSMQKILDQNGVQAFVLNVSRTRGCTWVVCAQNEHTSTQPWAGGDRPHGEGFFIGRVSGVVPSDEPDVPDPGNRSKVTFSEYAHIEVPHLWGGERNPVRYTSIESLGIDPEALEWVPFVADEPTSEPSVPEVLERAKVDIAAAMGVAAAKLDIEVTIRA